MKVAMISAFLFIIACGSIVHAQDEEYPDSSFFVGKYTLIGKVLEGNDTFLGLLRLFVDEDGREVFERIIGETTISGSWGIEYAIGNEVRVIRIRWEAEGRRFECTYQWCMDFDTYPRLSGHCYESGKGTDSPGMEVGFILHEEYGED